MSSLFPAIIKAQDSNNGIPSQQSTNHYGNVEGYMDNVYFSPSIQ